MTGAHTPGGDGTGIWEATMKRWHGSLMALAMTGVLVGCGSTKNADRIDLSDPGASATTVADAPLTALLDCDHMAGMSAGVGAGSAANP